ncbi:MAG: MFS transporter [Chlamydiota bacterium]
MNNQNSFTTYRSIILPIISFAIIMLGQGYFNTFVSIKLQATGFQTSIIAVVIASYFIGLVLGSLGVEKLLASIGHIQTFIFCACTNIVTTTLLSLTTNFWHWILFRALMGACAAGLFITLQSWLLLSSTPATKGKFLALYMISLNVAQGCGQFLLNTIDSTHHLSFLSFILLAASAVIPISLIKKLPWSVSPLKRTILPILKQSPFGVLGCLIAGMIVNSFHTLGPIFGGQINLSMLQISQMMGFTILGGICLQWPIGHLADLFGRLKVLTVVASIVCLLTLTLSMHLFLPYWVVLALCVLFGAFSFTLYPLSIAYTCDQFSINQSVYITGSLMIIYGSGSIIGPLCSAFPMQYLHSSSFFFNMAMLSFLLFIIGLWKIIRSPILPILPTATIEEKPDLILEEESIHKAEPF